MDWIKVTIYTSSEGIDPLVGRLYSVGITGTQIEDERDFKDFLENNKQYWDYVDESLVKQKEGETRVIAYVSDNLSGHEMLVALKNTVAEMKSSDTSGIFGRLEIECDNTREEDWANNWKKYFHPLEIGEKILVKPEWEDYTAHTDRIVFNINPGMTFGTGSHHTTGLCIEALERYITPGCRMLDLGCGSGILSIISLLLGAAEAYAADVDPNAVKTAYENAALNNIDDTHYHVYAGNVLTDEQLRKKLAGKYKVVCANIVADVIIGLVPYIRDYMDDDAVFITSGIIEDRAEETAAALRDGGFEIIEQNQRQDWISIICR